MQKTGHFYFGLTSRYKKLTNSILSYKIETIMPHNLIGKTILITGGTGSWGQELTRQLLANHKPKTIRIYSRGEHKQVEMKRAFSDPRVSFIIGDVRDKSRLAMTMRGVDTVFHL
ncbi:MAG: polysaccharide biosynthesis protein, partial [Candidatus Binatota bacterium]